ncbi:unnamed protein product [Camellia sinensis]
MQSFFPYCYRLTLETLSSTETPSWPGLLLDSSSRDHRCQAFPTTFPLYSQMSILAWVAQALTANSRLPTMHKALETPQILTLMQPPRISNQVL